MLKLLDEARHASTFDALIAAGEGESIEFKSSCGSSAMPPPTKFKCGLTVAHDADLCRSPSEQAALQGQIPRTNSGQKIKKPDHRLAIGLLTCFS